MGRGVWIPRYVDAVTYFEVPDDENEASELFDLLEGSILVSFDKPDNPFEDLREGRWLGVTWLHAVRIRIGVSQYGSVAALFIVMDHSFDDLLEGVLDEVERDLPLTRLKIAGRASNGEQFFRKID